MEPEQTPTFTTNELNLLRQTHSEVLRLRHNLLLIERALGGTRHRLEKFLELGISASLAVHGAIAEIEQLSAGTGRDLGPLRKLDADIERALSDVRGILTGRQNV